MNELVNEYGLNSLVDFQGRSQDFLFGEANVG